MSLNCFQYSELSARIFIDYEIYTLLFFDSCVNRMKIYWNLYCQREYNVNLASKLTTLSELRDEDNPQYIYFVPHPIFPCLLIYFHMLSSRVSLGSIEYRIYQVITLFLRYFHLASINIYLDLALRQALTLMNNLISLDKNYR